VAGESTSNQLYRIPDYSILTPGIPNTPPVGDLLVQVKSSTGLVSVIEYESLARLPSTLHRSDRANPVINTYPIVDVVAPFPVVKSLTTDSGVGSIRNVTKFGYFGLKAALDGRGMLGFRQSVQQNPAPGGGTLSVWSTSLLNPPYDGVTSRTETKLGTIEATAGSAGQLLSSTVNFYCDKTSRSPLGSTTETDPNSAQENAPCVTNAMVTRPYLAKSVETGRDLSGNNLPAVTTINRFNNWGDAVSIEVTTAGSFAGTDRTYSKLTQNVFCEPDVTGCPSSLVSNPNSISGDKWILGRLSRSTVTNRVPNLLSAVAASAGTAPHATAVTGPATPPQPLNPAVLSSILQLLLED
jgi:hypothetical protein